MTTGKTLALTRRTFVSKVLSQLFNMLSRLVMLILFMVNFLFTTFDNRHVFFAIYKNGCLEQTEKCYIL